MPDVRQVSVEYQGKVAGRSYGGVVHLLNERLKKNDVPFLT
jgi:hypothetical protein